MENFNYKGYRAANILKAFQQDIEKGGVGSGRKSNYRKNFVDKNVPHWTMPTQGSTAKHYSSTLKKLGIKHKLHENVDDSYGDFKHSNHVIEFDSHKDRDSAEKRYDQYMKDNKKD